jgi:hypothetical protein
MIRISQRYVSVILKRQLPAPRSVPMEETMAPRKVDDDGGNGLTPARCFEHQAKLSILEHRADVLEECIHTVTVRTEPLPLLCQHVNDLTQQVEQFLIKYQEHTAAELMTAARTAQEKLELAETEAQEKLKEAKLQAATELKLVATTTKLKTKTDVLWYVVIVLLLGGILAKMILPALFGA